MLAMNPALGAEHPEIAHTGPNEHVCYTHTAHLIQSLCHITWSFFFFFPVSTRSLPFKFSLHIIKSLFSYYVQVVTRTPGLVSVLTSPGINELLKSHDIKSVLICGLSTSGCVLSSTRAVADAQYITTVIADACADSVPGVHETLTQHVLTMQAHITTADGFQEQWKNAKSSA